MLIRLAHAARVIARHHEALALLDALPLDGGLRDDLLVTRAELRAASDCGQALGDFDQALARPLSDKLAERALRGRAVCRLRQGDRAGAEPDLREAASRSRLAAHEHLTRIGPEPVLAAARVERRGARAIHRGLAHDRADAVLVADARRAGRTLEIAPARNGAHPAGDFIGVDTLRGALRIARA